METFWILESDTWFLGCMECVKGKETKDLYGSFMFLHVLEEEPFVLDYLFKDVCTENSFRR